MDESGLIDTFFTYAHLNGKYQAGMSLTRGEREELFELGDALQGGVADRRAHRRFCVRVDVTIKSASKTSHGTVRNISGSGLLITAGTDLVVGRSVRVIFRTHDSEYVFTCEVVRQTDSGCAVRFAGVPLGLHHGSRPRPTLRFHLPS